jgi:hypothetical protein
MLPDEVQVLKEIGDRGSKEIGQALHKVVPFLPVTPKQPPRGAEPDKAKTGERCQGKCWVVWRNHICLGKGCHGNPDCPREEPERPKPGPGGGGALPPEVPSPGFATGVPNYRLPSGFPGPPPSSMPEIPGVTGVGPGYHGPSYQKGSPYGPNPSGPYAPQAEGR